jgi:hypothetical protein
MTARWRRELGRIDDAGPAPSVFQRAKEGSTLPRELGDPPRRGPGTRVLAIVVALAVFGAVGVFVWSGFEGGTSPSPKPPAEATAKTKTHEYFIRFPAEPQEVAGRPVQSARVVATTNLPEGTRVSEDTPSTGSCCPQVANGRIVVTSDNESCYGLVGEIGNAPPYTVTITVQPVYPGAIPGPGNFHIPPQPRSVFRLLGKRFQHLKGPQIRHTREGNELVASATYSWAKPQCGGPLPLFGGPNCPHTHLGQLQADTLSGAMEEIIGAISQARMCEFWNTDLAPATQDGVTWASFSDQWRHWFLEPPKDFSGKPGATWEDVGLAWREMNQSGLRRFVEITHHGAPLLRLEVDAMPGYCPSRHCGPNVVPFWGVASWTFA